MNDRLNDRILTPVHEFLDGKKKNTRLAYQSGLQLYADHLGITLDDLSEYVKDLTAQQYKDNLTTFANGLKEKKLNKNTIKNRLIAVRAYVSMNGLTIPANHHNQMTNAIPEEDTNLKSYSPEQARAVYKILSPKFQPIFMVLYTAGTRIGETMQIELKHLYLDEVPARIHLPASITKTSKGREVFISGEAALVLKNWKDMIPKYRTDKKRTSEKTSKKTLLFPMTPDNFRTALRIANKKLGLGDEYVVHSLRKSFRQNVGTRGKEADLAESLMGHSRGDLNGVYANLQENIPQMGKTYLQVEKYLLLTEVGEKAIRIHDNEVETLKQQIAEMQKQFAGMMAELKKNQNPA
jgi:integrase